MSIVFPYLLKKEFIAKHEKSLIQLTTLQRYCQWRTCHVQFPEHDDASCICMLSACVAIAACMWHYLQSFLFACIVGLPNKHVQVQIDPQTRIHMYTNLIVIIFYIILEVSGMAMHVMGWRWSLLRACKFLFCRVVPRLVLSILIYSMCTKRLKKRVCTVHMWEEWFAPCLFHDHY